MEEERKSDEQPKEAEKATRKSANLKEATHHLKEEALRRYKEKHSASFDQYEKELEESGDAKETGGNDAGDDLENTADKPGANGETGPGSDKRGTDGDQQRTSPIEPSRWDGDDSDDTSKNKSGNAEGSEPDNKSNEMITATEKTDVNAMQNTAGSEEKHVKVGHEHDERGDKMSDQGAAGSENDVGQADNPTSDQQQTNGQEEGETGGAPPVDQHGPDSDDHAEKSDQDKPVFGESPQKQDSGDGENKKDGEDKKEEKEDQMRDEGSDVATEKEEDKEKEAKDKEESQQEDADMTQDKPMEGDASAAAGESVREIPGEQGTGADKVEAAKDKDSKSDEQDADASGATQEAEKEKPRVDEGKDTDVKDVEESAREETEADTGQAEEEGKDKGEEQATKDENDDSAEQKSESDAGQQTDLLDAEEVGQGVQTADQSSGTEGGKEESDKKSVEEKVAEKIVAVAVQKAGEEITGQKVKGDAEKSQQEGTETQNADEEKGQAGVKVEKEGTQSGPVDGEAETTRGDEAEVMSSEVIGDEEEKIPDSFYYNFEDHVSKAVVSDESGLPNDMLSLVHSFGYDCQKRANLHVLDTDCVLFVAGNMVEILNLKTKEQMMIRSTSGGGVGACAVHPSKKYFAVAEKGSAPNINVYEYPSLKLYRILRGGTQEAYAFVDFSPDGKLLASVGGDPDFMLTLWNWKQEKTVLRSKAFSQDVFRVSFSTELEGQLTSAGTGHIRFWKMASTFTGLKLQGQLGKFGKTEISDIEGYVELPDGKVLSGSEWGNMLLWDGGLIKVEIARKHKKPCHQGPIQQIIMDEGELMTLGVDGCIRVWDFETIDTADITDESAIFEMEPMNELRVGQNVSLRSIVKSVDPDEPTMWYAQDANGGIWKLDLSFSHTSLAPEKLMSFHAGAIVGCDTSPVSSLVATIGADSTVRIYDYLAKSQLCDAKFIAGGSSLIWVPQIIDPSGATLVAGFTDGVVRLLTFQKKDVFDIHGKKKEDVSEIALKQAFKPHTKEVTYMAIDSKGEILATGSNDNTVFFLSIGDTIKPIGFVEVPSAVTHLQWAPGNFKRNTLLVCCQEGQALEIEAPDPETVDASHTYKITNAVVRMHDFKSVKSRLRHEEELARKAAEEAERKKKEEEERRIRIERGLETESEQGEQEEKPEEPQEEWSPYIPEEPSPILYGCHAAEEGKVWLSVGEFDAGYLYQIEFQDQEKIEKMSEDKRYEPQQSVPVEGSRDVPIRVIKMSSDGKRIMMGMQDGSIRIQPVEEPDISKISTYWNLGYHDNHYGHINHMITSFDEKFLFTVGSDGNFFVYEIMDEELLEKKIQEAKAKIPSAKKGDTDRRADDISDPNAYSIEDAKQKAEYDKMMAAAEAKKAKVRDTIADLRGHFRKIIERNLDLPEHLRLDQSEFEMDAVIKKELERQTNEKIALVKKEMAWEEEKHRIALQKLRSRFKDVIECERIVVKAFLTQHEVSSFRASKLPEDFYLVKEELERRRTTFMAKDELSRDPTSLLQGQQKAEEDGAQGDQKQDEDTKITTTLKGSMGERITKALHKVEEKKKKRAARRAQWEELYGSKPSDDFEDPADVAAIKEAQENMGDYKLKSADDYVVPDHLRMNTEKARGRLLVLKELIHNHKQRFNTSLLSLRDKKIKVIEEVKVIVDKLREVQKKLGPRKSRELPVIPELTIEEMPERKYEFTRDTLLAFKEELERRKTQAVTGGGEDTGGFGGGFGGGGGAAPPPQEQPKPVAQTLQKQPTGVSTEVTMETEAEEGEEEEELSDLEKKFKRAEEIRLLYERDSLFTKYSDLLKNFDAELRCLRHDKFKMDIDMKNADLRHVTLFEELLLLKDFEKRENVLAAKVEAKQQEKLDMQAKILEVQQKLENKKKDIEKLQEKERTLYATFQTSLGENNKFGDYLTKVFKKRIKRVKKKTTEGEGSDEESEDESDDDSDWSDEDEESDSEVGGYDLDLCPPGCDQTMYDNTCALREKRLDIEEALTEEKKNNEQFKKDLENLTKKAKVIDSALKTAENELEAFQLEKQRKINELDVVVTLKLHQIQYMVTGVLPQDLSQCLVFEQSEVLRLQHRIKELEHEKSVQKKQQKEARKRHVQLNKDRRSFRDKISELDELCNKMMMQKFGRIVDLEKLETVTVNRNVEELKERLRKTEMDCSADLAEWDVKILETKDQITQLIRENTNRLDQLNMLLGENRDFEKALDSRQKNLGTEFSGPKKADLHERQRLIQLVHLQAQEIEALKEEITLLSRKGGHILPPAQPPMPPGGMGQT